jgi:hypothetical protein
MVFSTSFFCMSFYTAWVTSLMPQVKHCARHILFPSTNSEGIISIDVARRPPVLHVRRFSVFASGSRSYAASQPTTVGANSDHFCNCEKNRVELLDHLVGNGEHGRIGARTRQALYPPSADGGWWQLPTLQSYSMTSLALASKNSGTVSPSAFAVLRLASIAQANGGQGNWNSGSRGLPPRRPATING